MPVALSFRSVTGGAWRDIGIGNSLFKDFLSRRPRVLRRASERLWIEFVKIGCESRYHRRAQDMPDIEHDIVRPLVLDKACN